MKRKVALVVEDNPEALDTLANLLLKKGFDVIKANDGAEAIRMLTDLEGSCIDIIITDDNMPNLKGVYFVKFLGEILEYGKVPVVLYTRKPPHKHIMCLKDGFSNWMNYDYNAITKGEDMLNLIVEKTQEMTAN